MTTPQLSMYTPLPLNWPDFPITHVASRIGNTPLLEVPSLSREVAPVRIMGKAEWFNPGGSVKDRAALNMILDGEKSGRLTRDKILLDATSGNTGIAYAMLGSALGYRVQLCIPRSTGAMHQRILKAYGAELIYSPATEGSDGAQREAIRRAQQQPDLYFYPDQYNNDANWKAHYNGTGIELLNQTEGQITHFVAGLGTSGTFTGTTRRLKNYNSAIRAISFQPDSPMHGLEGLKHMPTSIQPGFYDPELADENRGISTEDAQAMIRRVAREDGLLIGTSAGAALCCALQVARELRQGCVVAILADNAMKYLDQAFWG